MFLTNHDIVELTAWRQKLHAMPEISGEEVATAAEVIAFLAETAPDKVLSGLGDTGVAAVFNGAEPGPTVLFRCELDALPIEEISDIPHRSRLSGKGHMCGHDGHTATIAALARGFAKDRPKRGRVVLLFQPAEENGAGAAAVIADPRFAEITPDYSFSLHNLPGLPLGHVWLKEGIANCASRGLKITLTGKTAHASMPETGASPMRAIAGLMPALTDLSGGTVAGDDLVLATVGHVRLGEPAFGIAPGYAELWVTLRTTTNDQMQALVDAAEKLARQAADAGGLALETSYHEIFSHCDNHTDAVEKLRAALDAEGVAHEPGEALRASEDFGRFGAVSRSAMFYLGAGEKHPALHNPDYDFPDDLIPIGARILMRTARDLLR
ncbi:MAG: amidohydrolase [Alphaproteobacteria bacterium]|nr:amidohydrolase [Alphaproteobacteria bacterium]MBU1550575.1 amidohydrolase [Alphaproteobacteria bacterium]MBU2338711.1 amidohydrolase [Alphaproteobacteria bacterium]MBU2386802.1 amidohydrolase [Alphaproteobacteria bacterium]